MASTDVNADRTQFTDISRDPFARVTYGPVSDKPIFWRFQARSGKSSAVKAAVGSLGSYPLTPYLLYENALIARPRSSDQEVLSFIETYPELPIHTIFRRQFASFRMKQRDQDSFLKFHLPNEGDSEMQCFRGARALW